MARRRRWRWPYPYPWWQYPFILFALGYHVVFQCRCRLRALIAWRRSIGINMSVGGAMQFGHWLVGEWLRDLWYPPQRF